MIFEPHSGFGGVDPDGNPWPFGYLSDGPGRPIFELGVPLLKPTDPTLLATAIKLAAAFRGKPAPAEGEGTCMDCGGNNPVWFAPNEVWNLVIGGPEAKDDPGGIYCPNCFIIRAAAAGVAPSAWMLSPEVLANG